VSTNNKFTLAASKSLTLYPLIGAGLFLLLPVPFTVFQGPQHVLCYILCGGLAALFGWMSLRFKLNKVIVNGSSIQVRKGLWKKFSLDVRDIDRVDWITSFTKFGKNDNITVRAGSLKFKVETLMENSEKMIAYLKDYVDDVKIQTRFKDFKN